MSTVKISDRLRKVLVSISYSTGLNDFILFGGTITDYFLTNRLISRDFDIGTKAGDADTIKKCKNTLIKNGFTLNFPERNYLIYDKEIVKIVYAKKNKMSLEIVFMNDPRMIGQFNTETIHCRFPKFDIIDVNNSITAIKNKKIKCIRAIRKENPYLLLGRLIYICAKYSIRLKTEKKKKIVKILLNRIKKYRIKNNFQKNARASLQSAIFKSILKSKKRLQFVQELFETNILPTIFPELEKKMLEKAAKAETRAKITKTDIVLALISDSNKATKKKFFQRIKFFKNRKWNIEDQDIYQKVKRLVDGSRT